MKVDTHVHSIYSNRMVSYVFERFKARESYTTPRAIYDTCINRGMDLVTITDHNTIDGALEIADLPFTFLSEEITTRFPDDGMPIHVTALHITEEQHRELQRLKGNIFELAQYMRSDEIAHYVSHPLSTIDRKMTPAHVQKLILLFSHLEGRNGSREELGGLALMRLLAGLNDDIISRWAQEHGIEPVTKSVKRYLVGGSDDHGRLNLARAYTAFDTEDRTANGIREAFLAGRLEPAGLWGTPDSVSHNFYAIVFKYFQENSTQSAFADILNFTESDETLEPGSVTYKDRRAAIAHAVKTAVESFPDFNPLETIESSHSKKAHDDISRLSQKIVMELFQRFFGEFLEAIETINLERAFDNVPGMLMAGSVILPYLMGHRHLVTDREACEEIVAQLGFGYNMDRVPKVAIFTDTGYEVNGVSLGLRRMVQTLRELGHDTELVVCATPPVDHISDELETSGGFKVFEPIGEFGLPVYKELSMGLPSLVDVVKYLAEERISVVQCSTPGPLGVSAMIAGKLLGLKVVSNYHTEFGAYAAKITKDQAIADATDYCVSSFYKRADRAIAPSAATRATMVQLGIAADRVSILPRGVDTSSFGASKRDPKIWKEFGVGDGPKLLYVGRVSREKGIDDLLAAYEVSRKKHPGLELVVVGDGPYLSELKKNWDGVHFLGYQRGETLLKIFASADLFTFPSSTDTFGNVVIEAQASQLVPIVTDCGGPAEQVTHRGNGMIYPAGDVPALAAAIDELLTDDDMRTKLGLAGRRRAESMSLEKAARAQWKFYMECWGLERVDDRYL